MRPFAWPTNDAASATPAAADDGWRQALTPREQEVLVAIVAGKRNKVIGAELGISERTVESHRATSWTRPAPAASSNWSAGSSRPADAALVGESLRGRFRRPRHRLLLMVLPLTAPCIAG
jgi:hypothetical protein